MIKTPVIIMPVMTDTMTDMAVMAAVVVVAIINGDSPHIQGGHFCLENQWAA
jgi:hypothetical protein